MMDKNKIFAGLAMAAVMLFALIGAYFSGYHHGITVGQEQAKAQAKTAYKNIVLPSDVKTETKTVVKYQPKEGTADADVVANVGKQQLMVKVNGKAQEFKKADSEKYIFDQNKLIIDQTSQATFEIKVPTVDNTRRYSVGIGYGNHGLGGKIDLPIGKTNKIGVWVAGDRETILGGVNINF